MTEGLFSLYHAPYGRPTLAGVFAVAVNARGRAEYVEFQYDKGYLSRKEVPPLMPTMPLRSEAYIYRSRGDGLPGFVDELLPDAWGRRIMARTLFEQGIGRQPGIIDFLSFPVRSVLGSFFCAPYGSQPETLSDGVRLTAAGPTLHSALQADVEQASEEDLRHLRLAGASSSKGARPKFLAVSEDGFWLAKLSRSIDRYDVLLAEHAAMGAAEDSGLLAAETRLVKIGGIRALLVRRFDREAEGKRLHSVSANALLKDPETQEDPYHASYQDLARLVRQYSTRPDEDLRQLLGQALLNGAVRNTDDHLRNFSFLECEGGFRLSPAYDIVPTPDIGAYHQLSWGYSSVMPSLSDAGLAATSLGLSSNVGVELAESVQLAMRKWARQLSASGAMPELGPGLDLEGPLELS